MASDKIDYRNDFGMEQEVSCYNYSTNNKSQALSLEKVGKLTAEQPTKLQFEQNMWQLVTARTLAEAEPIQEPPKYTAEDLLRDIKEKLKSRGTLGIRGMARMFKILDNNGNR